MGELLRISTTEMQEFKSCRRAWHYSSPNRMNLEPKSGAIALWLGSGVHKALETYYGHIAKAKDTDDPTEVRAAAAVASMETYIKWRTETLQEITEDPEDKYRKNGVLGEKMLENYFDYAAKTDNFTPLMTEFEFEIPIRNPETGEVFKGFWVGKIDGLVRCSKGFLWVLEHKTYSVETGSDFLLLDEQTQSYQWAVQELIRTGKLLTPDEIVKGVIYNGLAKKAPAIPVQLKNGALSRDRSKATTGGIFRAEIERLGLKEEDYADHLEYLDSVGVKQFFKREKITRSALELRNFEQRRFWEYQDMANENLRIYPNPNWNCGWMCDYLRLCIQQNVGGDTEQTIELLYQQRKRRGEVYAESKPANWVCGI